MPLYAPFHLSASVIYLPTINANCNGPLEAAHCHIYCVKYDEDVRYGAATHPKMSLKMDAYEDVAQLIRMRFAKAVTIHFRTIRTNYNGPLEAAHGSIGGAT